MESKEPRTPTARKTVKKGHAKKKSMTVKSVMISRDSVISVPLNMDIKTDKGEDDVSEQKSDINIMINSALKS